VLPLLAAVAGCYVGPCAHAVACACVLWLLAARWLGFVAAGCVAAAACV